ncbi:MAG TPA: ClpXP protease specificity-enhancing factor SspB, partial [Myxococcaceae bacterium]|nr:ClpXP protease specificity-enhancing factor SspB [Myxococcaceae bacterium]
MDKKGPEKKARLLDALEKGMVMIHLDARRPGVLVPTSLRTEAHLRLNLSYRFDPPDLTVGEWGVRCTLSFSGSRFTVAVPWSALFAITSHVTKEFWMYPDDMPPELIQQTMVTSKVPESVTEPAPAERPKVVLREVVLQ